MEGDSVLRDSEMGGERYAPILIVEGIQRASDMSA